MDAGRTVRYYGRELWRRLAHYAAKRRHGYRDYGSLERAADVILASRAARGFESGGHFRGIWPRDLCFAAAGLSAAGYDDAIGDTGSWLVSQLSDVFFTDFHERYHAATPAEGVDTFPALVILLTTAGRLRDHGEEIADLAVRHRDRFVDDDTGIVTGAGSSWWDSAAAPRETYNTAMLLAAIERLEDHGVETTFTGWEHTIRDGLSALWNGRYFDEHRGSSVLACDANVVPLYLGIVDDDRARSIAGALERLETPNGLRMRERPFSPGDVRPFFLLHRDYHYHVWPWNSFMYANGLERYGLHERARREINRVERVLEPYGNFLEVLTLAGTPYVKRGYACAEEFTVAAALWVEYTDGRRRES